jgi:hypothetical protein
MHLRHLTAGLLLLVSLLLTGCCSTCNQVRTTNAPPCGCGSTTAGFVPARAPVIVTPPPVAP